jgi:uncharacterized membrane protein YphA (DoxX/SURF4 family)
MAVDDPAESESGSSWADRLHARAVRNPLLEIAMVGARVLLALAFIPSGLTKLTGHRFTVLTPDSPIGSFFDAFFQAETYYQFVGACQLLAALLLVVPRTATLGALIYLPIIANIFVITIALHFGLTAVITGLMLLGNLYLLLWDYDRWKVFLSAANERTQPRARHLARVTLGLGLAAVIGLVAVFGLQRAWLRNEGVHAWLFLLILSIGLGLVTLWLHLRSQRTLERHS